MEGGKETKGERKGERKGDNACHFIVIQKKRKRRDLFPFSICHRPNIPARLALHGTLGLPQAKQVLYDILYFIVFSFWFVSLSPLTWIYITHHLHPPRTRLLPQTQAPSQSHTLNIFDSLLATTPAGAPSTRHRCLRGLS